MSIQVYRKGSTVYIILPNVTPGEEPKREYKGFAKNVSFTRVFDLDNTWTPEGFKNLPEDTKLEVTGSLGGVSNEQGFPYTNEQFKTFTEENTGIEVTVPLVPSEGGMELPGGF